MVQARNKVLDPPLVEAYVSFSFSCGHRKKGVRTPDQHKNVYFCHGKNLF